MKDPSRIPPVVAQLQKVWEAQPDLSLPTLLGILGNRGIGWGSSDEDLVAALNTMYVENPGEIRGGSRSTDPEQEVPGRFLVETESPAYRITVDPFRVSVRRIARGPHRPLQPGVWEFQEVRRCRSGEPLVITDAEGIDHRLGVVVRITLLNDSPDSDTKILNKLRRREVGDKVYYLHFENGDTALLNHGLEIYQASRRSLEQRSVKWDQLITATPGQALTLKETGSGKILEFGVLERIIPLED